MHKNMILQNLPLLLIALSPRHRAAMAFTSPHISVCYLAEQGILTRRFGQLTVGGLSPPPKIRSLAGCSKDPHFSYRKESWI